MENDEPNKVLDTVHWPLRPTRSLWSNQTEQPAAVTEVDVIVS